MKITTITLFFLSVFGYYLSSKTNGVFPEVNYVQKYVQLSQNEQEFLTMDASYEELTVSWLPNSKSAVLPHLLGPLASLL
jgi:hypothetical protein